MELLKNRPRKNLTLFLVLQFVYESEKDSKEADILKEISQGQKLRHVRCNDRSKPNLRGGIPRIRLAFHPFLCIRDKNIQTTTHQGGEGQERIQLWRGCPGGGFGRCNKDKG